MAAVVADAVGASLKHPLEPLSVDEIAAAVEIVRSQRQLGERMRFVTIALHEPPKDVVLAFVPGSPVDRQAFLVLLDNATGWTYEVVVSLTHRAIARWDVIENVQPAIMLDEFLECEQACKASPEWQAGGRQLFGGRGRDSFGPQADRDPPA